MSNSADQSGSEPGRSEPGSSGALDLNQLRQILNDSNDLLTAGKEVFTLGNERIHQCYQAGTPASVLIRLQTALTDLVLLRLWSNFINNDDESLTIAAVGGYGRGELHPHSDIDIAILLASPPSSAQEEGIGQFLTGMWDLGLQVGHSVRTVEDCRTQAEADVTVVTNLMEARYLSGSRALYDSMLEAVSPDTMWPPQAFFDAKISEQEARRNKFQNDAYRLEPNLKESSGGLRDLQTIFWVSQRIFNTHNWDDLMSQDILTADEFETLMSGMEFLWMVRYLLHRLAGRAEDRLLFDHQRSIAHEFGHTNDVNNESIENLMQVYFRHVTQLQWINEIILQGFGGIVSGVTASTTPVKINKRFQIRNGFLEVTHDRVFLDYPPALLEIFNIYSNEPSAEKIRANTARLLRSNLHLINKQFRDELTVRDMFMQIFRNPHKLTRCIRMMTRYGVLAAYLPQFSAIVGRMQYDLFHIYTVDQHTTRVIRNLRRYDLEEFKDELPHCSNVMKQISQPEYLYLMGLFHDIAKGRGGDHSELGAEDALIFCQHHGLDQESAHLVAWTVRHHLVMSMTAQRKDISDPDIIQEFAETVGTRDHLNHLYLLTVADIRATNPELWNSFKENLLRELYESTLKRLKKGLQSTEDLTEIIHRKKQKTLMLMETSYATQAPLLWNDFNDSYFLHYQTEEIALHTRLILTHRQTQSSDNAGPDSITLDQLIAARDAKVATFGNALVLIEQNPLRGSTEVLIYCHNDRALFASITTAMDQLKLDIQSAEIATTKGGYVLDSFYVLEDDGSPVNDSARIDQITQRLGESLNNPGELPPITNERESRRLKHFSIPPRIEFDNSSSTGLTSVYIEAADQPGILSIIGRCFLEIEVQVQTAKIATFGERIEDVFYVTNSEGAQLTDIQEQDKLRGILLQQLTR